MSINPSVNMGQYVPSDCQMLAVKQPKFFTSQQTVINAIGTQFINRVPGFACTSNDKAHMTLYMGWDKTPHFDQPLQKALLDKIAKALENTAPFKLELSKSNTRLEVSNRYVLLFVDSNNKELNDLQNKVQTVAKKFVTDNNLVPYGNWFNKKYKLHVTLGSIDRNYPNSTLVGHYDKNWVASLQSQIKHVSVDINTVTMIGIIGINGNTANKVYHPLGKVVFRNAPQSQAPAISAPVNPPRQSPNAAAVVAPRAANSSNQEIKGVRNFLNQINNIVGGSPIIEVKSGTESTGKRNITVTMESYDAADKLFKAKGISGNISSLGSSNYQIRLGLVRFQMIFGQNEGTELFNNLLRFYDGK